MKKYCLFFALALCSLFVCGQQLIVNHNKLDIGVVENALQVVFEFKIYNATSKQNYILKVDIPQNCSIQIEDRKLGIGDSTSLLVYYNVLKSGNFYKDIFVHSANCNEPLALAIAGKIKNVAVDDLQACHPSVKNKKAVTSLKPEIAYQIKGIVIDAETNKGIVDALVNIDFLDYSKQVKTDAEGLFSFESKQGIATIKARAEGYSNFQVNVNAMHENNFIELPLTKIREKIANENQLKSLIDDSEIAHTVQDNSELSRTLYAPNQIVFLIDKSASMKEPEKLPALKLSIKCLLNQLRDIDFISIITYDTEANLLIENMNATNKDSILSVVDALVAGGQTSGGKGIALAYSTTLKHYIDKANNEIILATDGEFKLKQEDELLFKNTYGQNVRMSILAFGNDKKDLLQLFKLSLKTKGSYLQIKNSDVCDVVLENIKANSKK